MTKLQSPFRLALRRRARLDVEEEFAFHIEMRTNELVAQGWSHANARTEAERQFGDLEDAKQFCGKTDERRESRTMNRELLQEVRQDVSFAMRALRRAPAFSIVAILTLALGIGANTAIFSVVRGILLKPLPFQKPSELVMVTPTVNGQNWIWSPANLRDVQEQSKTFTSIAAMESRSAVLTNQGSPAQLRAFSVSADFFPLLGLRAVRGRLSFTAEESAFQGRKAVIMIESLWRTRFGSDTTLIGRNITIDNEAFQVVGIAPNDAIYPANTDLWFPFSYNPADLIDNRGSVFLRAIARVKPGVPLETATADVRDIAQQLAKQYPDVNGGLSAKVVLLSDTIVGDIKRPLWILLGGVAFVLLIACANVANLLLVRSVARESELAVRTALGAGRGRLVRQLATESLLLSVIAGAIGLALAAIGTKVLLQMAPSSLPRIGFVRVDSAVLLFTLTVSLLTSVIFGLLPSRQSVRPDVARTLREGTRGAGMQRASHHARRVLVVVELALSVMLLAGAGLLIKSFERLTSVDPGFRTDHSMSFSILLPEAKYPDDDTQRVLMTAMTERLRALGSVDHVSAATGMPLTPFVRIFAFSVAGRVYKSVADWSSIEVRVATPDYLATMEIPVIRGRGFTETDRKGGVGALLITESGAKKFFPDEDPIGRHITTGWGRRGIGTLTGEIVGVVGDFKQLSLADKPHPMLYAAYDQWPVRSFNVVVHSQRDFTGISREAAKAVHEIDPDLALSDVKSLDDVYAESVAQPRFYMLLLTVFAALALILSSVGVYGVIAYLVGQRTREIGIRVALGASRLNVIRLVAREGLTMTLLGISVGLGGAFGLSRLMQALLFETAPTDVSTYALVVVLLALVATAACLVPALRASRIDPVLAIRAE